MSSENEKQWPEWLTNLDPAVPSALTFIDEIRGRLRAIVADGYEYQHVANAQLNAGIDGSMVDGKLSAGAVPQTSSSVAALVASNSRVPRMLATQSFVVRLAVLKHLDAFGYAIAAGDLIVAFSSLRAVIEHVGHLQMILKLLASSDQRPGSFDEANASLAQASSVLLKSTYGTRIDWKVLFEQEPDLRFEKNRLKYQQEENRGDRKADSILDAVDLLAKKVKGTRAVYEILCEFTHPNVGNLFAITESAALEIDPQGVGWIRKRLTAGVPHGFVSEASKAVVYVLEHARRCLEQFENLLLDADGARQRLLATTQVVVRRMVAAYPELWGPYTMCPCGAGAKTKFCCGKH